MEEILKLLNLLNSTESMFSFSILLILLLGIIVKYFKLNLLINKYVFKKETKKDKYLDSIKILKEHRENLTALRGKTDAKALIVYQIINGQSYLTGNPMIKAKLILSSSDSHFNLDSTSEYMPHDTMVDMYEELTGNSERPRVEDDFPNAVSHLKELKDNNFDKYLRALTTGGALTVGLANEVGLIHMFIVGLFEGEGTQVKQNPLEDRAKNFHSFLEALNIDIIINNKKHAR